MYFVKKRLIGKFIGVATAAFLVLAMMPGLAWGVETNPGDVVLSGTDTGVSLPQDGLTPSVSADTGTDATTESTFESVSTEDPSESTIAHSATTEEASLTTETKSEEATDFSATQDSLAQLNREQVQLNNLPPYDPIKKEVSVDGVNYSDADTAAEAVTIGPGGTVYYRLTFENQTEELTGVDIADNLPDGFMYITNSAKLKTATSESAAGEFEPDSAGLAMTPQKLQWKNRTIPAPSGDPAQNAVIIYAVVASKAPSSGDPIVPYMNTVTADEPLLTGTGVQHPTLGSDVANVVVTDKDLLIDKKVSNDGQNYSDSATVGPGDAVFFEITVENKSTSVSDNFSITDVLPDGFAYREESSALKIDGATKFIDDPVTQDGILVWSAYKDTVEGDLILLDLVAGKKAVLTFEAVAGAQVGTFENKGSVWKTSAVDSQASAVSDQAPVIRWASDTVEVSVGASMTKQVSVASAAFADEAKVKQGEKVTYKVVITNPGDANITGIKVVDTLPAGFSYVDASTEATDSDGVKTKDTTTNPKIAGQVLTWPKEGGTPFTVKAGETYTLTYDVTASKVVSETAYENKAEAFQGEVTEPFSSDSTKVTVILKEVKKLVGNSATDITHDSVTASPSATVHYKITVKNDDTADVTGLTIEDTLPTGFSYQTGSTSGATTENPLINGQKLTWSNITAKAGQETSLTFKGTASSTVSTTAYVNTAEVKKGAVSQGSDTASVTVTGTTSLSITKSADKSSASPNDTLTYTISYSNTGNVQLTNVVITDGIPTGSSYVAGSATGGGVFDQAANALTWTVGNLAAGGSGSVSFKVAVSASATGTITNTATIDADQTDPKTASASTTVVVVLATTQQPATLPGETGSQVAAQAAQLPTTLPKTGLDLLGYLFGAAMLVSSGLFLRRLGRDKR